LSIENDTQYNFKGELKLRYSENGYAGETKGVQKASFDWRSSSGVKTIEVNPGEHKCLPFLSDIRPLEPIKVSLVLDNPQDNDIIEEGEQDFKSNVTSNANTSKRDSVGRRESASRRVSVPKRDMSSEGQSFSDALCSNPPAAPERESKVERTDAPHHAGRRHTEAKAGERGTQGRGSRMSSINMASRVDLDMFAPRMNFVNLKVSRISQRHKLEELHLRQLIKLILPCLRINDIVYGELPDQVAPNCFLGEPICTHLVLHRMARDKKQARRMMNRLLENEILLSFFEEDGESNMFKCDSKYLCYVNEDHPMVKNQFVIEKEPDRFGELPVGHYVQVENVYDASSLRGESSPRAKCIHEGFVTMSKGWSKTKSFFVRIYPSLDCKSKMVGFFENLATTEPKLSFQVGSILKVEKFKMRPYQFNLHWADRKGTKKVSIHAPSSASAMRWCETFNKFATKVSVLELVMSSPYSVVLGKKDAVQLAKKLKRRDVRAGRWIYRKGESVGMSMVVSGKIDVALDDADPPTETYRVSSCYLIGGRLRDESGKSRSSSKMSAARRHFRAATDCIVLELPPAEMLKMSDKMKSVEIELFNSLSEDSFRRTIVQSQLFNHLDNFHTLIYRLLPAVSIEVVDEDCTLFRQAHPGSSMFLLHYGNVEGSRFKSGVKPFLYQSGDSIAYQVILMERMFRTMTVRAVNGPAIALKINARTLRYILKSENISMMSLLKPQILQVMAEVKSPFLNSLPNHHLPDLLKCCYLKTLANDDVLFKKGDKGSTFYIVYQGQIQVELRRKHTITLNPGEAFGEVALLRTGTRTATCKAKAQTALLAIESNEFFKLFNRFPQIITKMQIRVSGTKAGMRAYLVNNSGFQAVELFVKREMSKYGPLIQAWRLARDFRLWGIDFLLQGESDEKQIKLKAVEVLKHLTGVVGVVTDGKRILSKAEAIILGETKTNSGKENPRDDDNEVDAAVFVEFEQKMVTALTQHVLYRFKKSKGTWI